MDIVDILKSVDMSYEYIEKSKETAGNKYKVTLKRNGKSMSCEIHTNRYDEVELKNVLDCLCVDRQAFASMYPDYWTVDYFRREFCYSEDHKSDAELEAIMKVMEKNSRNLERLFSEEDLREIEKYFHW